MVLTILSLFMKETQVLIFFSGWESSDVWTLDLGVEAWQKDCATAIILTHLFYTPVWKITIYGIF